MKSLWRTRLRGDVREVRKSISLPTHMAKMAANEEKQQGHRPGVYKQKNKGHKHGKHRTKGEIERENKGRPCSVAKCYRCRCVSLWLLLWLTHVFCSQKGLRGQDNTFRSDSSWHQFLVRLRVISGYSKFSAGSTCSRSVRVTVKCTAICSLQPMIKYMVSICISTYKDANSHFSSL